MIRINENFNLFFGKIGFFILVFLYVGIFVSLFLGLLYVLIYLLVYLIFAIIILVLGSYFYKHFRFTFHKNNL